MKKFMLYLAVGAFLALTANAAADIGPPPPGWISSQPASDISGPSATSASNPFGPQCVVNQINYQLLRKGNRYFVQFTGLGACAGATSPWTAWRYGGTTPKGWNLQGFSSKPVLRVPLNQIGKFWISFTVGDDLVGSQTCAFTPNFKFGYTATQLCH